VPELDAFLENYDRRRAFRVLTRGSLKRSRAGLRTWLVFWPGIPVPLPR
jgi:hypothetical protein